jgi:hypothetical protein
LHMCMCKAVRSGKVLGARAEQSCAPHNHSLLPPWTALQEAGASSAEALERRAEGLQRALHAAELERAAAVELAAARVAPEEARDLHAAAEVGAAAAGGVGERWREMEARVCAIRARGVVGSAVEQRGSGVSGGCGARWPWRLQAEQGAGQRP